MFGSFFFGLVAVYVIYYTGMVGYDLYVADKMREVGSTSQEIDIAAAASSYVAKDVRTMFDKDEKSHNQNDNPQESDTTNTGGIAEYIGSDYQEGYSVETLTDLFEQEAQTPSLFSGIQMSM